MHSNLHPATAPLSCVLLPNFISSCTFVDPATPPHCQWSSGAFKNILNKIYFWCTAISIPPLPHRVNYYCLTSSHHGNFGDPATPPLCQSNSSALKFFFNKIYCWCVAISIPPPPHWVVYLCLTSSHHGTFADPATPPHCHLNSGRNFSTKASVDALWSPPRHHPTEFCIIP